MVYSVAQSSTRSVNIVGVRFRVSSFTGCHLQRGVYTTIVHVVVDKLASK